MHLVTSTKHARIVLAYISVRNQVLKIFNKQGLSRKKSSEINTHGVTNHLYAIIQLTLKQRNNKKINSPLPHSLYKIPSPPRTKRNCHTRRTPQLPHTPQRPFRRKHTLRLLHLTAPPVKRKRRNINILARKRPDSTDNIRLAFQAFQQRPRIFCMYAGSKPEAHKIVRQAAGAVAVQLCKMPVSAVPHFYKRIRCFNNVVAHLHQSRGCGLAVRAQ